MSQSVSVFTPEQEKEIQAAVDAEKMKQEQALIEAETMRRIYDIQSQQPGYRYT